MYNINRVVVCQGEQTSSRPAIFTVFDVLTGTWSPTLYKIHRYYLRMRSKATLCAFWASLIPFCLAVSCDQLRNPYQGPADTQFEITCNAYSLGGNQIGPTIEVTDLASCVDICATMSGCKAALFDRSQYLCYTLDESDGPASNSLYDMAVLLSSAASSAAISSITFPTTTSAVSTPTPCNQLDNPSYIDGVKLTIFCSKKATGGNQVDFSNQLRSFTECMTFCVDTVACRAVTFESNFNECTLFEDRKSVV